jgi:hypothetical protein
MTIKHMTGPKLPAPGLDRDGRAMSTILPPADFRYLSKIKMRQAARDKPVSATSDVATSQPPSLDNGAANKQSP